MAYKWKPSKAQRTEFAQRMQNSEEKAAYEARKTTKAEKRRSTSSFEYNTAGGNYVPTKTQHDFCFNNIHLFQTSEEQQASNMVIYGYSCQEKVHHDYIHIVNEKQRKVSQIF